MLYSVNILRNFQRLGLIRGEARPGEVSREAKIGGGQHKRFYKKSIFNLGRSGHRVCESARSCSKGRVG